MKRENNFIISGKTFTMIIIASIFLLILSFVLIPMNKFDASEIKEDRIYSLSTSRDSFSDTQWYIDNPGYYSSYSLGQEIDVESNSDIDMNVTKAWEDTNKTNKAMREVVVAVIDTGIDYSHPDLKQNMWVNKGEIAGDHIDNDNNGYIDDVYGWDFYNKDSSTCHYDKTGKSASSKDNDNHGSHIAGIIGAVANNKIGIAGVASNINIKIMTLKINGGRDASGRMSDAIEAVRYASKMGADICNLSWGTTEYSKELKAAMQESGMLFIAAAGNSGANNDKKPIYPADFQLNNMITVTSIDADGDLNRYSNYGAKTVEIAAPGNDIYSTIVGGYGTMSGSSMAAPQVSAVAAMLYATNDHLYAANVKKMILNNLKKLPDLKGRIKYEGIPDALKAVKAAGELIRDVKAPDLSATYSVSNNNKSRIITVKVSDIQSGLKQIKYLQGSKKSKDFLNSGSGTEINLKNGQGTFRVKKDGTYTVFASDYAGNYIVKSIAVKTGKATQIKFAKSSLSKAVGERFNLRLTEKPYNTTDKIYYESYNQSTISKGSAVITAKTRSGVKAICEIKVNLDG